ncbi:hypothetical protein ElyMa_005233400 [Elysia marginata]|uniref:Uncharacterized protein n=1 Tax=Elysia marginata TaxID=1093978 RepID=A0AAV4JW28_9GAST|nr:hypothetical protein ElyMa_005233400 [Elysia marginata]
MKTKRKKNECNQRPRASSPEREGLRLKVMVPKSEVLQRNTESNEASWGIRHSPGGKVTNTPVTGLEYCYQYHYASLPQIIPDSRCPACPFHLYFLFEDCVF